MSWNPLKRLSAPQRPGSGGLASPTSMEEREVENLVAYLNNLCEVSKRLHLDAKRYTEAVHSLSKNELKMAHELSMSAVCHYDDELRILLEDYDSIMVQSEQHCDELIMVLQKALVEPMKNYRNFLHDIQQQTLRKREVALQECQKFQAKVEKLQDKEKTGPNVAKFELSKRALENARKEVVAVNHEIAVEFPKIFATRITYFQPCLEAVIRAEVNYSGEFTKLLGELVRSQHVSKTTMTDEAYENSIQSQLSEIRALSIVVDD